MARDKYHLTLRQYYIHMPGYAYPLMCWEPSREEASRSWKEFFGYRRWPNGTYIERTEAVRHVIIDRFGRYMREA